MIKMKKVTKLISLTLMALFIFVFLSACGGNNHELVGTWVWDTDTAFVYTFNDDGTGVRGGNAAHPTAGFEWSIDDDDDSILLIECPVAMLNVNSERWNFAIEDDVLILNSLQGGVQGARYTRQ